MRNSSQIDLVWTCVSILIPTSKAALKMTLCFFSVTLVVVKMTVLSFPLSVTAAWISLSLDSTLQRSKVSLLEAPFKRRVATNT